MMMWIRDHSLCAVAVLLYPSKMLYPGVLPLVSMFDALYKDAESAGRKLKLFWIVFAAYVGFL